jgi:putative hydrolase of the HAD superfamily
VGPVITHVLFDADGVLQDLPGGWYAAMEPFLGDRAREFLHRTWADELPTLAGQGDYLPMLEATLREYGVEAPVTEVYAAVWHRIDEVASSFAVVGALRAAGYGVHLATNQERHRGTHMHDVLGYRDRFDVSAYSWEVGAAKPDPEFFHRVVRLIGAPADEVLFIDDNEDNVHGARSAGLVAEHWHFERGPASLVALLATHGVSVDGVSVDGVSGVRRPPQG